MNEIQEKINKIKELAAKYNIQIHECAGNIIIAKTLYGHWKFDITDNTYSLYHRPLIMWDYIETAKKNDGYHNQNKRFTDLRDLFDYIYRHDILPNKNLVRKNNYNKNRYVHKKKKRA